MRRLVGRGDRVVAVVRDPDRAEALTALDLEVHAGDLSRTADIVDAMRGCDAAIHLAGMYRIGIPANERARHARCQRRRAPDRTLDAARRPAWTAWSMVSTLNVAGNTHGRIVDERYRRDLGEGFLSYYDETKFLAHRAAQERMAAGAPIVIVLPGVDLRARRPFGHRRPARGAPTTAPSRYLALGRPRDLRGLRRGRRGGHRRRAGSRPRRRVVFPCRREPAAARCTGRGRARW